MKKLFFTALTLCFTTVTTVNANSINEPVVSEIVNENERPVKTEELPDGIKKTLSSDDYLGWTVGNAFFVKGDKEHYRIHLIKGDEKKAIKLNAEGDTVV